MQEILLYLLLLGMNNAQVLVYATRPNTDNKHEYWQGVNENDKDLRLQSRYHQNGVENLERLFYKLNANTYNKHRNDVYLKTEILNEKDVNNDKPDKPPCQHFKRGKMTKFFDKWIVFIFILHCLCAGALLDHWTNSWNIY